MTDEYQDKLEQQTKAQKEQSRASTATKLAGEIASSKMKAKHQNPEFLDKLRDADLDTDDYPWLENLLGPATSGAHFVGHRDDDYEQQVKWGNLARSEQLQAEATPGRLCRGRRRELALGTLERDRKPVQRRTTDELRAIRAAMVANTNIRTNSVEGEGRKAVADATAVAKEETSETEETTSERVGRFLG